MRFLTILSLILFSIITQAQDRKDIIRMKDGSEIQCQILKVSEADSVIQFCMRENGELKAKKVQSGFVASFSWPGKEQAGAYCRMLGVKTIRDGEIYKGYWNVKPSLVKPEQTSTDQATIEIKQANKMLHIGFAATSVGFLTAMAGPYLIHQSPGGNSVNSASRNAERYDNQYKAIKIAGYGLIATGVIAGLSSIPHFTKARLLQQESQKGLSLYVNSDGLCLAFTF